MSDWIYEGQPYTSNIGNHYGFIYKITNLVTGKKYIGRKYFTKAGSVQKNGKKKKIRKESDWTKYYGSSPELAEDVKNLGKDCFAREILRLCHSRGEVNYFEAKEIFAVDAIISPDYYNNWVSAKCHGSHLKHVQPL